MTAYAIANLRSVDRNQQVADYLLRIDATLEPFSGRFLVHGAIPQLMDGELPGVVVVIEFPDLDRARAWYASRSTRRSFRCAPATRSAAP
ncbi:MAG TPA: DUF1330 domain-containing protein [Frankiaceae bacterium]|nr:DUF1330 domain-containing protein [Frankiaceae bacterium]